MSSTKFPVFLYPKFNSTANFPIKAVICSILVAHMKILRSINFSFSCFLISNHQETILTIQSKWTTCHHLYPQASIKSCRITVIASELVSLFYHTFNSQYHSQCDPFWICQIMPLSKSCHGILFLKQQPNTFMSLAIPGTSLI